MNNQFPAAFSPNINEICDKCGMIKFPNWPHRCMMVRSTNANVTPVYETNGNELPVPDFMKRFSES